MNPIRPIKCNPGGLLAPDEIIGRDELVKKLWRLLDRVSVVLCAERRTGKTNVIKGKMLQQPKPDFTPFYIDVEDLRTPLQFADSLFETTKKHLSTLKQVGERFRHLIHSLGGGEFAGVKIPEKLAPDWHKLIERLIDDLVESQTENDGKVLLFWDEIPIMLDNFVKAGNPKEAMAVLDLLRKLRMKYPANLRMVFTGSVGLHHILKRLKSLGHNNDPTNDMTNVEVLPLEPDDALYLAQCLIQGENLKSEHPHNAASAIAACASHVPFYIQKIVVELVNDGLDATPENAEIVIGKCLAHDDDPWHMRHYETRIRDYYGEDLARLACVVLDAIAAEPYSIKIEKLKNVVSTKMAGIPYTEIQLRDVVTLLSQDHYIAKHKSGLSFQSAVLKKWWKINRGDWV